MNITFFMLRFTFLKISKTGHINGNGILVRENLTKAQMDILTNPMNALDTGMSGPETGLLGAIKTVQRYEHKRCVNLKFCKYM